MPTHPQKAVAQEAEQLHMECPTCHRQSIFQLVGEQNWPPHIAEKAGLPATVQLWKCGNCETTITRPG